VFWLNSFPAEEDGINHKLIPCAIVIGTLIDYNKHCKLEFGTNVQVHEEQDNSLATRTTGAIALQPTGNEQGGYYFYSLTNSGRVLNRNHWTALPMPAEVIDQVHVLACRNTGNGTPELMFTDRNGASLTNPEDDDSDDESYYPDEDATSRIYEYNDDYYLTSDA
jgi:hypothetical protein